MEPELSFSLKSIGDISVAIAEVSVITRHPFIYTILDDLIQTAGWLDRG